MLRPVLFKRAYFPIWGGHPIADYYCMHVFALGDCSRTYPLQRKCEYTLSLYVLVYRIPLFSKP